MYCRASEGLVRRELWHREACLLKLARKLVYIWNEATISHRYLTKVLSDHVVTFKVSFREDIMHACLTCSQSRFKSHWICLGWDGGTFTQPYAAHGNSILFFGKYWNRNGRVFYSHEDMCRPRTKNISNSNFHFFHFQNTEQNNIFLSDQIFWRGKYIYFALEKISVCTHACTSRSVLTKL